MNVRASPSTSSSVVAKYYAGQSVKYDKTVSAEGRTWISYIGGSGNRRYCCAINTDGSQYITVSGSSSSGGSSSGGSSSSSTNGSLQKFLDVLAGWMGLAEPSGDDVIINLYNSQRPSGSYKMALTDPWCAATMAAAAYKSGNQGKVPNTCSCATGVSWFKNKGLWHARGSSGYNPQKGDIIYYDWNGSGTSHHVGCCISRSGNNMVVREGNKNAQHHQ